MQSGIAPFGNGFLLSRFETIAAFAVFYDSIFPAELPEKYGVNYMTIVERECLARKVAKEAGAMLKSNRDFHARIKGEHDFVTDMDEKCEAFIRNALLSACPEDGFFGEESGGSKERIGRWIVDPIDGTMNFIKGLPNYCVSIAYEQDGQLVLGCVYLPETDELFAGMLGQGATCNGKAIHVSGESDLSRAVVSMSFSHRDPKLRARVMRVLPQVADRLNDMRRFGSAATDLCYTACGRLDGYFELGIHLYDYAAGAVILREAGGVVTGWDAWEDGIATGNILASNGHLHEALRCALTEK